MSSSITEADDIARRAVCADRLRAAAEVVVQRAAPELRSLAVPLRTMDDAVRDDLVRGYLGALAAAVETDSFTSLRDFFAPIDDVWVPSGLTTSEVIRAIYLISDACQSTLIDCPDASPALWERWNRETVALVADRAVQVLTGQLKAQLVEHEQTNDRLLSLQRVSTAVVSELDLERTLEIVVNEARRLMHGSAAAIWVQDDDPDHLRILASDGATARPLPGQRLPIEGSLTGDCFRSGAPLIRSAAEADAGRPLDDGDRDNVRSLLMVPLMTRDQSIGVLVVTDEAQGAFDQADLRLLEFFAEQAATAIEHARLFARAQSQIGELAALQRISNVISSSLDLDEVFQAIYDEIRAMLPADAFLIGLSRDDGRFDIEFVIDGGQRYAPSHGLEIGPTLDLGRAIRDRVPVVVGDLWEQARDDIQIVGNPATQVRSVLAAPLVKGNQLVGLISAQSYAPHTYRTDDADLLMTIANHAVVAIEHARLYAQAQTLAVAEERNRLAREIHDTLAQGLIGIILLLERLDLALPAGDVPAREVLNRALSLARGNLEEARRSVRDLRAAPLEGRTLIEAIEHLVDDLRKDAGFAIELAAPVTLPLLAARVETALFRVAQEALSNCRKHGQCANVRVELRLVDNSLSLKISDDGQGFEPLAAVAKRNRFGLTSMRERIEQIGGELRIESEPGAGTTIQAELPFQRAIHTESNHAAAR